jgi:hypothetical protein
MAFQQAIPPRRRANASAKSSFRWLLNKLCPPRTKSAGEDYVSFVARHFRWRLSNKLFPEGRRLPMKEEELMLQPAQSLSLMAC